MLSQNASRHRARTLGSIAGVVAVVPYVFHTAAVFMTYRYAHTCRDVDDDVTNRYGTRINVSYAQKSIYTRAK